MTDSIKNAVIETKRRRDIQEEYNRVHGTIPKTVVKPIGEAFVLSKEIVDDSSSDNRVDIKKMSVKERERLMSQMEKAMLKAAKELDFERAMELRDALFELKEQLNEK